MAENTKWVEKYLHDILYIKWINSQKGYGVFTSKFISRGEIIEKCYCIKTHLPQSFEDYMFKDDYEQYVLPLGYGCIYNHDENPNIERYNDGYDFMVFKSLVDIEEHHELCHNYGRKI